MTQLIFKNNIDQSKMNVLLGMLDSWGVEAEVQMPAPPKLKKKSTPLTLSVGMWAERNIDDKELRARAWSANYESSNKGTPKNPTSLK
ncbi:MAG: hypothetical protein LBK18_05495 [Prevotellaceae bacterium]|jgi:hypothetical protein|nr:hypothetical protein [Prevotellaceae bacterium]